MNKPISDVMELISLASWCFSVASTTQYEDAVEDMKDEGNYYLDRAWFHANREFARGGR